LGTPGTNGTTPNDAYLVPGSGSGTVVLHNVGAGSLAANSTDAVNGAQVNTLGTSLAAALGSGASFNAATGTLLNPTYSVGGNTYTSVGSAVSALDGRIDTLQTNFSAVTSQLQTQINKNRQIAAAGIAGATASGQIRYDDQPGKVSIGIGGGFYDGQGGLGLGIGFTSEDRALRGNFTVNVAPGVGKVGGGAGFSYSF